MTFLLFKSDLQQSFKISADRLINDSFKVSLFFTSSYKFFTLSLFHWHYYDVSLYGFLRVSLVCSSKYVLNLLLDSSISFGKFLAMISSNCFNPILLPLTYDSIYTYVRLFYCPMFGFLEFSVSFLNTSAWMFFSWPFFQFINEIFNHIQSDIKFIY